MHAEQHSVHRACEVTENVQYQPMSRRIQKLAQVSPVPIVEVAVKNVRLYLKREDLIHPQISGNKFWKLLYNIDAYLDAQPPVPHAITFGGAFSNHISATAAVGKALSIKTLGIIRGEELIANWRENPTLAAAAANGMEFRFVSRSDYREKEKLAFDLHREFPGALIIPEGGTNELAVKGVQYMLDDRTAAFDYLCCAVGTGGTVAGLSKFAEDHQSVLGFKVVNDDSLKPGISGLSGRNNFELIDAAYGGYGKITDENVEFVNAFYAEYGVMLDPIYTAKMMRKLVSMIEEGHFENGVKILAFHTGGLQGIDGANELLRQLGKRTINF